MNQLLTCFLICSSLALCIQVEITTQFELHGSRRRDTEKRTNIPDYGSTLSIPPSMPSPLPLGMDCSHFSETILSTQWLLPLVDYRDVFAVHELQDCLDFVLETHNVVVEYSRSDKVDGMTSGFAHAEARVKDDASAVVRMNGIDKVVAFADREDSVVVVEHVAREDDLKDVGMDAQPLGNSWGPVASVEADSIEVGFAMELKSVLEGSRQAGSADRKVKRIRTWKID